MKTKAFIALLLPFSAFAEPTYDACLQQVSAALKAEQAAIDAKAKRLHTQGTAPVHTHPVEQVNVPERIWIDPVEKTYELELNLPQTQQEISPVVEPVCRELYGLGG